MRQADRMIDKVSLQRPPPHDEVHVDAGEDLRIGRGPLGLKVHFASGDVLAAFLQDCHNVVRGTAPGAQQHHLHRPRRKIAAAALGGAVHRNDVIAARLGEEGHSIARPTHDAFHLNTLDLFLGKIRPFSQVGAMKTYTAKVGEVEQGWYVVDAQNKVLGKLATQIAVRLRGKHKPQYTPHVDTGDYVAVVNASKVRVTGRKTEDKVYYRHSGYPGGLKETNFAKLRATKPERVLQHAVKGMLPKGPLGYAMLKKLKVYAGATHPHSAQQPKTLEIA